MSGISGPSGVGGPSGPSGPEGPDDLGGVAPERGVEAPAAAQHTADLDALSAQIAAGTLTPQEAIDRLVEATATPEMDPAERAELRALLTDLVANDPYLGGLAGRI